MTLDTLEDDGREQMEDAHFWEVDSEYGVYTRPIDEHAVYGSLSLGDRCGPDAPHRDALRDLVTAIRTVDEGDRVRVNDRGWMSVVDRDGEWFLAEPVSGVVTYRVGPANPLDRPPGTFDEPWMRRVDTFESAGRVYCLEVDWNRGVDA